MKRLNKSNNLRASFFCRVQFTETLSAAAIIITGFVQAQETINYSGYSYSTGYGNTSPHYYNGTATVSRSKTTADETAELVNQMNADSQRRIAEAYQSLEASRQRTDMRYQTEELQKQTKILSEISEQATKSAPTVILPQIYTPPTSPNSEPSSIEQNKVMQNEIIWQAKRAKSFSSATNQPRDRQLSRREGTEYENLGLPENEEFIKSLLQAYSGDFTDYQWIVDSVDDQTYIVTCKVSLDGESHDFKFKVNGAVGSCRYEGGTALGKLAPAAKTATSRWWEEAEDLGPVDHAN